MNIKEMLNDLSILTGIDFIWKQASDSPLQKTIGNMTHRSEFCQKIKSKREGLEKCVRDCSDSIHYDNVQEIIIRKTCHAGGDLICMRIFSEEIYLGSLLIGPFSQKKEHEKLGSPYFEKAKMNKIFSIIKEVTPLLIEKAKEKIKLNQTQELHPRIVQIKAYIEKNFNKNITVEDLSLECHLSGYRLMHIFKNETKQTIFQYLIDYRIKKACELLKATSLKINVIAGLVGFQSTNFFNSKFKLALKTTPQAYREKNHIPTNP